MSQLTIYRASAGSGKTFKLTGEYLKLIFRYPNKYKQILAVTFTNKATEEMKSRIISELNNLARGKKTEYADILSDEFQLSETQIKQKATTLLNKILHNYSRFSVGTIDSFFQNIIRAFIREIGLQVGFNIELDNKQVLNTVTDRLLMDIESHTGLKNWLIRFAMRKIEEGKSWNFKFDILQLGDEIFKEKFKSFNKELVHKFGDREFLDKYHASLYNIKNQFEEESRNIGLTGLELMKKYSLDINDICQKSQGPAGYFQKLSENQILHPGKKTLEAYNNIEKWYLKNSPRIREITLAYNEGLNKQLGKSIELYRTEYIKYNSSVKILSFIYTLGILTDISLEINEYSHEKNIFLLSDATFLLQEIIDNNETPFVYEKTGNIFKHFMIDEFQDTSMIQWNNFKPLIRNSLSENNKNILVGDIKQSIYRWRNSDWNILSSQIKEEIHPQFIKEENLEFNWRSQKNIIHFNNNLFYQASYLLQEQLNDRISENLIIPKNISGLKSGILNVYQDIFQSIPPDKPNDGGYLKLSFISKNKSYEENIFTEVIKVLELLQDKGLLLKDIAILTRKIDQGKKIAAALLEYQNKNKTNYKYNFISNEVLYVNSSPTVRFILALLKYLDNPEDEINKAFIRHEYISYIKNETPGSDKLHLLFDQSQKSDEILFSDLLPGDYIKKTFYLKKLPLYELTEKLIDIFSLPESKEEIAYLQAFQDIVIRYSRKESNDINTFMTWWKESGYKETVNFPEQQDAIRILTIHKAKGLEFKAVIIPFCNWKFDHEPGMDNILWCKPETEPFNQLELVPVRYGKDLINTIFTDEYLQENLHSYIDNLNLLYVAFTRAREILYTFSPIPDNPEKEIKDTGDLLYSIFTNQRTSKEFENKLNNKLDFSQYWDKENQILEIGTIESTEKDLADQKEREIVSDYPSFPVKNRLKMNLSNMGYFFFADDIKMDKINYGRLMHELFENIIHIDDIDKAISRLVVEGKISNNEGVMMKSRASQYLNNSMVKEWFSDKWNIKTEAEILLTDGSKKRPDRVLINGDKAVVIDYKFGEKENVYYLKQVKEYAEYLKILGYKEVQGYVWYAEQNVIKEIN